jgi:hypothetical protein
LSRFWLCCIVFVILGEILHLFICTGKEILDPRWIELSVNEIGVTEATPHGLHVLYQWE